MTKYYDGAPVVPVIGGQELSAANPLPVSATFTSGDIEIGAVEMKDGASDNRAKVAAGNTIVAADNALAVRDANPIPAGTNAIGTVSPTPATGVNTPAIVTSGGDVLAANANRKGWSVQNCGTNPLFVRLATGASSTVFHAVLKGCAVADDGSGGFLAGDGTHKGVISATGTSPRLVVMELS